MKARKGLEKAQKDLEVEDPKYKEQTETTQKSADCDMSRIEKILARAKRAQ